MNHHQPRPLLLKSRRPPNPKRCVNTAGDSFESFLEREAGELTINISVNEPTFNPILMDGFKHSVNDHAVTIDGIEYAANTLKLSPPTATKITETIEGDGGTTQKVIYYKVSYVRKAKANGWADKI